MCCCEIYLPLNAVTVVPLPDLLTAVTERTAVLLPDLLTAEELLRELLCRCEIYLPLNVRTAVPLNVRTAVPLDTRTAVPLQERCKVHADWLALVSQLLNINGATYCQEVRSNGKMVVVRS